jgi:hypothetical protein
MTLKRTSILAVTACSALLFGAASAVAAPPANTAPPTITGTPKVGETLTAQNGTWSNDPTAFQYQWRRCDSSGGSCVNIPGATQKTYTVRSADAARTLRVVVTAVNADGAANARSAPTAVVTAGAGAPQNTTRPSITGDATVGEELTADPGSWSGSPTFSYQWQRCDSDGSNCLGVTGATGQTYGVRSADLGFRLRVAVTAHNTQGSATASSGVTAIVEPAAPITNARPTLVIVSIRFLGARVYARLRICDDSNKNLTIIETDSRPGRASYTRRFSTLIPPRPCGVYTRNWTPLPRFRGHGRYTITLRARDTSGQTSLLARRTFSR